jgi:hypothetical protein
MRLIAAACVLCATVVTAAPQDQIVVGDLPGTNGVWQRGEATVAAPRAEVQSWFSDVSSWPQRFSDVQWAKDLGTSNGVKTVQFKSKIIGRPLTIHVREQPGLIVYTGEGKGVTTQGRLYFQALGPNQTRTILQTTADLHGPLKVLIGENGRKQRARKKLHSDLAAAQQLSRHG